jgi:hypothetical protein
LAERFGEGQVFMDVDSLDPGVDFVELIETTIETIDVLIAVIGPAWLNATNEDGARRLDDPGDYVRVEIGHALARDIHVVPVLVRGASMPKPHELPEDLRALVRRNALVVTGNEWRAGVERLIATLDKTLASPAEPDPGLPEERLGPRQEPATTPSPPAAAVERAGAANGQGQRIDRSPTRLRPTVVVAALALVLAALAAVAFLLLPGGDNAQDPAGGGNDQALASYVRGIDVQLQNSAKTRGDLVGLINRVTRKAISPDDALAGVSEIIGQRKNLQAGLPPDPPEEFRDVQHVLDSSITASLNADQAAKSWIEAFYGGSEEDAEYWYQQIGVFSDEAGRLKHAFLSQYNKLRRRLLDLPPLQITTY